MITPLNLNWTDFILEVVVNELNTNKPNIGHFLFFLAKQRPYFHEIDGEK